MPERKPYLKGNIIKPNPLNIERYKNLVKKSNSYYEYMNSIEREADEMIKLLEKEIKEDSYNEVRKEIHKELEAYYKYHALESLKAKLKNTVLRINKDVKKEALEKARDKATKVAEKKARKHYWKLFKKIAPKKALRSFLFKAGKIGLKVLIKSSRYDVIEFSIKLSIDTVKVTALTTLLVARSFQLSSEQQDRQIILHRKLKEAGYDTLDSFYLPPGVITHDFLEIPFGYIENDQRVDAKLLKDILTANE